MFLLGYDIGSSSVKASLVDAETGRCIATAFYPEKEAPIISKQPGWAEQDPPMWLGNLKLATADVLHQLGEAGYSAGEVKAIGISYQMHGLVCVDKDMNVLIVEDIIDTGRTLALLKDLLLKRQPKSLKICTAFDKPSRRVNDLVPDYNGITVPDEFIVGYGLDLDGRYRDFDDIRIVRKE